jgi:phage terminase large subunit GpA-like protein
MFTDPLVKWIYLCCGTQLGKTTYLFSLINYIVDYAPASTYLLYPTKDSANAISKERVKPLFDDCPSLTQHKTPIADDFKNLEYHLDRMTIRYAWNSIPSVSTHPAKYVLKDETKDIDSQIDEAANDRTKAYFGAKIVSASSPLIPTDCIWRPFGFKRNYDLEQIEKQLLPEGTPVTMPVRRFEAKGSTTVYKYFVKCPHCLEFIELHPDKIRWPRDCSIRNLPGAAYYECQICGDRILDRHKRQAVKSGKWITDNPGSRAVGFHLSSLYSLLGESCTFGEIAATYLRAHISKSEKKMQAVVNSYFAWPWEAEEHGTELIQVTDLIEATKSEGSYRKNDLPDGVHIITAGVDVHKTNIYYSVWGWGEDDAGYLLDYGIYDCDMDIDDRLALEFCENLRATPYGERKLRIIGQATDTGYKAETLYTWARKNSWIMPVKGERGDVMVPEGMEVYIRKSTKIDKTPSGKPIPGGIILRQLNTGLIKREIYDNIRGGAYRFPLDVDQKIIDQLNSEHLVTRRRGGKTIQYYAKKKKADEEDLATTQNHYLDTVVYARAAKEILCGALDVKQAAKKYYAPARRRKPRGASYDD